MPERIETAELVAIDPQVLEVNDTYPGTYGFYVRLSRDPGLEWAAEFEAVYEGAPRPAKPPVVFRGDTLCVYYLPLYQNELGEYLAFLKTVVADTNAAVLRRNAVLPNDHDQREAFRQRLSSIAQEWAQRR